MILIKILFLILCYLIGSLSPAIILCKAKYSVDIRTLGSGNAGTTNVLRNFGKRTAAATLLMDACKGIICYFAGLLVFSSYHMALLCGLVAVLGHIYPLYYGFRGGKGVATTMGLCLVAAPKAGLIALACAVVIIAISRRISLGSLLGSLIFTALVAAFGYDYFVLIWAAVITLIIWIKHRENIKRILSGNEPKFSLKK